MLFFLKSSLMFFISNNSSHTFHPYKNGSAETHIWADPCKVMFYDYERRFCLSRVTQQHTYTYLYVACDMVELTQLVNGYAATL